MCAGEPARHVFLRYYLCKTPTRQRRTQRRPTAIGETLRNRETSKAKATALFNSDMRFQVNLGFAREPVVSA
jgi:hypothetical protein